MSNTITLTDGKATIEVPAGSAYALEALGWTPVGGTPEAVDDAPAVDEAEEAEPNPKAGARK